MVLHKKVMSFFRGEGQPIEERFHREAVKTKERQAFEKEKLILVTKKGKQRARGFSGPSGFGGIVKHVGKGFSRASRQTTKFMSSDFNEAVYGVAPRKKRRKSKPKYRYKRVRVKVR